MSGTRSPVAGAALLLLGLAGGWAISRLVAGPSAGAQEADQALAPGEMSVAVTTAPVERGALPVTVAAAGTVRADPGGEVVVTTRAWGRVGQVLVAPGQAVGAGDVLARLDPAPLDAARVEAQTRAQAAHAALDAFEDVDRERTLAELRAAEERTRSQSELASAARARAESLHGEGLASDKALAEARQAEETARSEAELARTALESWRARGEQRRLDALRSEIEAADAALRQAEAVLSEADVRAHAAGQVLSVAVRPGAWLDAGGEIARLARPAGRVVSFGVGLSSAGALHAGSAAWWTDPAGARHEGSVARVLDAVASELGLVEVVATPTGDAPAGPLGLSVRGELETGQLEDVVLVPEGAVLRSGDARVVVLAGDDGRAHVIPVELLGAFEGRAAVSGALDAGARVVVEGGYNLPDGARLVVKDAPPSAGDGR